VGFLYQWIEIYAVVMQNINNKDSSFTYFGSLGNGTTNTANIANCCKAQGAKVSTSTVTVSEDCL
jgi:hypothetical protein